MEWKQRSAKELAPELIEKYQLSPMTAKLFSLRGINTDEELNFWFNATEADLADPNLMHDLTKAVQRINQAIDNGEKITIYGDYDADGITATTIMMENLEILGADVHYFIPDRFRDGYGPNLAAYQKIVADGTKLIITVDNGVTGVQEVAYAKSQGVDTIITDHHTFQEEVPAAYAIVHCNYPGQKYPFDDYCGAGVAYTICRELMQDPMSELLELAMIGTIGDMVKVSGEGHVIVKRGLAMLNQTQRPGLRALIKNAGLKLGSIDETDVGFNIAPRLNAVGRLADASLAVELLLCDEEEQARELAAQVEELNDKRKELTTTVYQDCLMQVQNNGWQTKNTLVIYNPDFHEGVLGLVANKVVEKYHKPTIVLTKNDQGEIKGSGRSTQGFNLFNALNPLKKDLLTKFGGHDFACGLSMTEDKIAALRDAFEASFEGTSSLATKYYDLELPLAGLTTDTVAEISQVGPFGTDNVQPIFSITHAAINNFIFMGKDKTHIRFQAVKNGGKLDVVGFNKEFLTRNLLPFIDQIFIQLGLNTYRKQTKLQGIITGFVFKAPQLAVPTPVVDLRQEKYIMGFADKYLLFDDKNRSIAENSLGIEPAKISLVTDYQEAGETAVLLDAPHSQQELDAALTNDYQQLYLRFLLDQLPVETLPAKADFARVLKYVYRHPELAVADYRQVAPFLGLDYNSVLFILRVFFELDFVKMEQGKIVGVRKPVKQPLTSSRYFCASVSQIKFVHELRQMPTTQLLMYVNSQLKRH
ncbi:single-stranded-DNA-specific exonuclease RecJ [Lactobacillus sp. ESL0785]|uniref:single-stranded-DNA-specific exonuclease RecJ n=1 Tax=Lactobacillus sp. ESL0785 TaxID=2983232 RepID=UPI0023F73E51|nr:single-stranded-DNA-specific exonuclease RecJ [Lactobacillus sp. ESL0785]WEV71640.1 single-stranded-DNA-specific exonuclease RecJ [Lactobacillus sp. ESL0785]